MAYYCKQSSAVGRRSQVTERNQVIDREGEGEAVAGDNRSGSQVRQFEVGVVEKAQGGVSLSV
jgi:hypothetical protein